MTYDARESDLRKMPVQQFMEELKVVAQDEVDGLTDIPVDDVLYAAWWHLDKLKEWERKCAVAETKQALLQETLDRAQYDLDAAMHQLNFAILRLERLDPDYKLPHYPAYDRYLALSDPRQVEFGQQNRWARDGGVGGGSYVADELEDILNLKLTKNLLLPPKVLPPKKAKNPFLNITEY